jgi:hypothetical protein
MIPEWKAFDIISLWFKLINIPIKHIVPLESLIHMLYMLASCSGKVEARSLKPSGQCRMHFAQHIYAHMSL